MSSQDITPQSNTTSLHYCQKRRHPFRARLETLCLYCTRQRKIVKATKRYPSDLTDKEWKTLRPLLLGYASQGRPRHTRLREFINTLQYIIRSGCRWRMLPKEFGPWQIIYWWFRRLMRRFLFSTILNICIILDSFRYEKNRLRVMSLEISPSLTTSLMFVGLKLLPEGVLLIPI